MLIQGNTILLDIYFLGFDNLPIEVSNAITQVFDAEGNQIDDDIDLTSYRFDVGYYRLKYTVPTMTGEILFRSTGTGLDGNPYVTEVSDTVDWGQYNPSLSRPSDIVRFILQDTDESNLILKNDEINAYITMFGSPLNTAIQLCSVLAAKFTKMYNMKELGDLKIQYRDKAKEYAELQRQLKTQLAMGVVPYLGGLSQQTVNNSKEDTDIIQPKFTKDEGENKNQGRTTISDYREST